MQYQWYWIITFLSILRALKLFNGPDSILIKFSNCFDGAGGGPASSLNSFKDESIELKLGRVIDLDKIYKINKKVHLG